MMKKMRLLVGHEHGLSALRSSDGGATWTAPELLIPEVKVTSIVQLGPEMYAGTRGHGVFRRPAGPGKAWEPIETPPNMNKVRSLSVAGDTLLAGTEPAGVFRWVDRRQWQQVGDVMTTPGSGDWSYPVPTVDVHVRDAVADPTRPERIYAAIQVGGIALSPDGGSTWLDRVNLNLDVHQRSMILPMPAADDWTDFVHTGPGTLAGRYLRMFWQPVYRSQDLAAGQAVPIRILGEDLTACAAWPPRRTSPPTISTSICPTSTRIARPAESKAHWRNASRLWVDRIFWRVPVDDEHCVSFVVDLVPLTGAAG